MDKTLKEVSLLFYFSKWVSRKTKNFAIRELFTVNKILLPFIDNLANKSKIVSLRQNVISRLIQICQIQWWLSLHLFWNENILFAKTQESKNCWFLDKFRYAEVNGDVHLFIFGPETSFWANWSVYNKNWY